MATSNSSGSVCSSISNASRPWERLDSGETAWGDFSASEQGDVVRHYAPKVKYLALRMKAKVPPSVELSDLVGAGTLGLMESFTKFQPKLGVKFDTYAENRIRGAMLDELRRLDWFPRSLRRRVRILDEATHKFEHGNGRPPSEEDLARETGLGIDEVREGLEALQNQYCLSLELIQESLSPDETAREESPYAQTASRELADRVAQLIDQLTPREKLVLSLYYTDELNMRETAEVMGITEGRVSQLHSQALARLRREFAVRHGDI